MYPFFLRYGAKYKICNRYPMPAHPIIVESFAGSAAYAVKYEPRKALLYDTDPVVCGIWDYLIHVKESEFRSLPTHVTCVDECAGLPQEVVWLFGFWWFRGAPTPRKRASAFCHYPYAKLDVVIPRIADQLHKIREWEVFNASYDTAPDIEATWFVDPPYDNPAGRAYSHKFSDYSNLATWCQSRKGQVIVCENEGATWLPFVSIGPARNMANGCNREEAIWVNDGRVMYRYRLAEIERLIDAA